MTVTETDGYEFTLVVILEDQAGNTSKTTITVNPSDDDPLTAVRALVKIGLSVEAAAKILAQIASTDLDEWEDITDDFT